MEEFETKSFRFSTLYKRGKTAAVVPLLCPTRIEKKKREKGRRRRKGEEGTSLAHFGKPEEPESEFESVRPRSEVGFIAINHDFLKGIKAIG